MTVAAIVVPAKAVPTAALHCAQGIRTQAPSRAILPPPTKPHNLSTFEWTDAVSGALPYLDAGDMHRALRIFDCAMTNFQQARDVKNLLDACAKDKAQSAPNPLEDMLSSLHRDRQLLFIEFQQLLEEKLADMFGSKGPLNEGPQMAKRMPCNTSEFGLQVRCGDELVEPSAKITVALAGEQEAVSIPSASEDAATVHQPQCKASLNQDVLPPDAVSTCSSEAKSHHHGTRAQGTHASNCKTTKRLSTILGTLSSEDANHIFSVRRISHLGYKTERILKSYFAQYGGVVRVLLAHSTARARNAPHGEARCRQGSLGFVQMDSAKAVEQILAFGVEHKVKDVLIRVQRFQSHQHAMFEDGFLTI